MCPGGAQLFLAAVRSPPLRGGQARSGSPGVEKPRHNAEGRFVGGMRSARPQKGARGEPRQVVITESLPAAGGQKGEPRGPRDAFPAGVQSPPLRGGRNRGEIAWRGKTGDDVKGRSLGGARSPRPRCTAVRKPRHGLADPGDRVPPRGGGTWQVALREWRVGKTPSGLRACRARPLDGPRT